MKGVLVTFAVLIGAFAFAFAAVSLVDNDLRWSGISTTGGGVINTVIDTSLNTFWVDTMFSDTLQLDSLAKWLNAEIALTGYTLCDSCNDSVVFVVHGYAAYNGAFQRIILTDTIPNTLGTLDSTMSPIQLTKNLDSLVANQFWFRTIVKDSIKNSGHAGLDTLRLKLNYKAGYKAVEATYQ